MSPMQNFEPAIGFVAPDGTLTEKGRALNPTGRDYVLSCWRELAADMPRPAPDPVSVPKRKPRPYTAFNRQAAQAGKTCLPANVDGSALWIPPKRPILEWTAGRRAVPTGGHVPACSAAPKVGKIHLGAVSGMLAVARGVWNFIGKRETVKRNRALCR